MKKAELIKLLKFLNSYYQQKFEYPKAKIEDSKMVQETWMMFLGEYDYGLIKTAVKKLVVEKEWPPTPGEVAREIQKLQMPDEEKLSGQEAWGRVVALIRRYGVQYGREKILGEITDAARIAIEAVGGLHVIGMSAENETYLMNSFVRAYKSYQERKQEKQMLPGSVREDIEKIGRPEVERLTDNFKGDNQ